MKELLDFAFSPPVIVYSILLLFFLLYWFTVIIGIFDLSSFDFDVDIDADLDIDADADVDVESSGNITLAVLGFFNFGKVPFMVIMLIFSLSMWTIAVLTSYYFSNGSIWFSIALIPVNLLVSLSIAKIVTTPLISFFKSFNDELKPMNYIGSLGQVTTSTSAEQFGKVELWVDNSYLTLKVKAIPDFEGIIERGTEVIISDSNKEETIFFVRPTTF